MLSKQYRDRDSDRDSDRYRDSDREIETFTDARETCQELPPIKYLNTVQKIEKNTRVKKSRAKKKATEKNKIMRKFNLLFLFSATSAYYFTSQEQTFIDARETCQALPPFNGVQFDLVVVDTTFSRPNKH
eukprot:TCONS_00059432-protein